MLAVTIASPLDAGEYIWHSTRGDQVIATIRSRAEHERIAVARRRIERFGNRAGNDVREIGANERDGLCFLLKQCRHHGLHARAEVAVNLRHHIRRGYM